MCGIATSPKIKAGGERNFTQETETQFSNNNTVRGNADDVLLSAFDLGAQGTRPALRR